MLITNSDLKVLVTYPNTDEEAEEGLQYLHRVINGNRHAETLSEEESFLIIFGFERGFIWEGYVYKGNDWKQIISDPTDTADDSDAASLSPDKQTLAANAIPSNNDKT